MSNPVAPNVVIRHKSWAQLVKEAAADEQAKPEPGYEFSNGRTFNDTGTNGGPYRQP